MLLNRLIKIPLPICGLALGSVALGNLLSSYHEVFKIIFSLISSGLLIIVTISFVIGFEQREEQLQNPVIASVFPTYFMATALLSGNFSQYWPYLARFLWLSALCGHLIYMVWFTLKFVRKETAEPVIPSWFIVYVGYVACANVSKLLGYQSIGHVLVILGMIGFVAILVLNLVRIKSGHVLPDAIKPLNAIFSAPLNLCIVGYIVLFNPSNHKILIVLLILSILIFFSTIVFIFRNDFNTFYPSFAAYTFPLVITVTSYKLANNHLWLSLGNVIGVLELICTLVVLYVLYKYAFFVKSLLMNDN